MFSEDKALTANQNSENERLAPPNPTPSPSGSHSHCRQGMEVTPPLSTLSLVPRRSPPAHSTRLGAKCRNVTEWGPCGMPFGDVRKFRAKSCEREENAWVLGWSALQPTARKWANKAASLVISGKPVTQLLSLQPSLLCCRLASVSAPLFPGCRIWLQKRQRAN